MPSEGKKLCEVNVAVMEDAEGTQYLHATGDGIFNYIFLWNSQMRQGQEELREKILAELENTEENVTLREVIEIVSNVGKEDESSANH